MSSPPALAAEATTSDPLTRQGVEKAIAVGALMIRAGLLFQLAVGSWEGRSVALHVGLYLACAVVAATTSISLCVALLRRRRLARSTWTYLDLGVAFACLPLVAAALPNSDLIATWAYWPGALGINAAALAGIWLDSRKAIATVALAMSAATFASTWSAADVGLGTLIGNAVTCVLFAGATHVVTSYLRRIADENDQLKLVANLAGREAEMALAKWTMHDPAGLLGLLGDESTPREQIAPLRKQARLEANRLRAYLRSAPGLPSPSTGPQRLTDIVERASQHFGDQPMDILTELASGVVLSPEDAPVVERALFTLLQNIRRHARATHVIVHADRFGGVWELLVRDDGVGFDPATTPLGFGLGVQVIEELQKRGMSVDLRSSPGEGTVVTITKEVTA